MILVIDNYDSFTYNLVQALGSMGAAIEVFRNDKITPEEVEARRPERIIISPGPCDPPKAGQSMGIIKRMAGKVPILGVCLGHQCIGEVFGGKVIRAGRLMHGKTSMIEHDGRTIFTGVPSPFEATRYHSLVVEESTLPDCLYVTARTTDRGELMGLRHREYPVEGVQFHPESFLTAEGPKLLKNFIDDVGRT